MSAGKVKIEINYAEVGRILKGSDVASLVDGIAADIANAASASGGVFGHNVQIGRTRARAIVFTDDLEAMKAEATDRALTRAIDAGRR